MMSETKVRKCDSFLLVTKSLAISVYILLRLTLHHHSVSHVSIYDAL